MASVISTPMLSSSKQTDSLSVESEDVSPSPASCSGDERKVKSGRHSRFSAEEDLVLVREISAAGAHVAAYGKTRKLFEEAAAKCSANSTMSHKLSWKQVQDRYTRLQSTFDKEDIITHLRSGIGEGQLSELNELLSQLKEARDDLRSKKDANKEKTAREESEKERIGQDLTSAALDRKKKLSSNCKSSESRDSDNESEGSERQRRKRRRRVNHGMKGDLAPFGEHLKESDLARIKLEREQLVFQREKFSVDCAERDKDREERKEEREASNRLELEKMKVMMEAFTRKSQ